MGDAAGGGHVHDGDPDETIDAASPAERVPDRTASPDAASDYGDLPQVDRQHYVIGGELAKGGMGRVLVARDRRLGRQVAIKELLPRNRHEVRRFEREARITARLQHPAIIHIYEAGTWPGGEPFYAMPKVEGESLDVVVGKCAGLHERIGLLPNVIAVADALAYAHSQRVIHRDLKPSNVLVGEFGETVVIDWGLAKDLGAPIDAADSTPLRAVGSDDTAAGGVIGTPAYMPPEQARGDAADLRSDVYSLGALLYKVLAGTAPYAGATANQVLDQVEAGPPRAIDEREPATPPELVAIVGKAMARDPAHRYAHAGELAADLKRFQTGQLVAAHRYTARQLLWRFVRRHRLAVSIALIASVVIAVIATLSVRRIVAEKARAEARRAALLEEFARNELLDGNAGKALAYLAAAVRDGPRGGVAGFLIADARRPFDARLATLDNGPLAAVSPDGTRVAVAGVGSVEIWTLAGELVQRLPHEGAVHALAWDAAGERLAAGDDRGILWVWDRDGRPLALLAGHDDAVLDVELGPDHRAVTASADGTSIVWDVDAGKAAAISTCHKGRVVTARFSGDGGRVVTASDDGTACVWSARTGETLTLIRGHDGPVNAAAWANDDRWIVTASDDGTARVWSAARGKPVVAPLRADAGSAVRVVAVSHDGRLVLTAGSDQVARVWRLPASESEDGTIASAPVPAKLAGHVGEILTAAFSDDDALVATGGRDHVARLWDATRGQPLAAFEHDDAVETVAFAGSERLVTGSRDGRSTIWKARPDEARHDLHSPVNAIAVAPDGTVAAGREDSRVTLVRPDGRETTLRGHMGRVFAVAFTPDGSKLVTAGADAAAIVWDVATGAKLAELAGHSESIHALAISPSGLLVATAAGDTVRVFRLDGTLVQTLHHRAATVHALAFSPRTGYVEGGADDGAVVDWDAATGEPALRYKLATAVTALACSPRDGTLAIAGAGRVDLLARDGTTVALDNPGEVWAAAFTSDGTRVVTGGEEGAKIWDATTGKLLGTRDAHALTVKGVAVHGDLLWLASVDHTISAWDVHSDREPPANLAAYVAAHDPWVLDSNDVIHFK
ncbi:MAG: protein kinase domain-containing protein [Acidobacteriota bacterium]